MSKIHIGLYCVMMLSIAKKKKKKGETFTQITTKQLRPSTISRYHQQSHNTENCHL